MTAKTRNLPYDFPATHSAKHDNLLVSGCSFTYNNSDKHVCTWPYYLRNHANYKQVFDCSQSGAGSNHIFNSTVNEIETNRNINSDNTLVIIMWSGLTRTDVVATQEITKDWHSMSNYCFDEKFSTLSIFNQPIGKDLDTLCKIYKTYVDTDAQIYESLIKIIALKNYLENKEFDYVFTSFQDPLLELSRVNSSMTIRTWNSIKEIDYLREYALSTNRLDMTDHPTPECHAQWTREKLIAELEQKQFIQQLAEQ